MTPFKTGDQTDAQMFCMENADYWYFESCLPDLTNRLVTNINFSII
jgi:uncharacterized protein YneR